jgi:hypothetical protein
MKTPSVRSLIRYYGNPEVRRSLQNIGITYDFPSSTRPNCMACGYVESVHRAHIIPKHMLPYNADWESNVHLLCPNCHAESEGLAVRGWLAYYNWMKWVNSNRYKRWQRWMYEWYLRSDIANPRLFATDVFKLDGVENMPYWEAQRYVVACIQKERDLDNSQKEAAV